MKKIIILLVLLAGCKSFEKNPVFEHQIIKQIRIENPSFLIFVEKDKNNYYTDQIEDVFIKNKIPVFIPDKQTMDSESSGWFDSVSGKGTVSKGMYDTKATCIYLVDSYYWTFKVILVSTHELLMKGRIKYELDKEIPMMVRELTGL